MNPTTMNQDRNNTCLFSLQSQRRFRTLWFLWQHAAGVVMLLWPAVCNSADIPPSGPAASIRWAGSSNRIYVENDGSATLSDIKAALPHAPLDLVDPTNGVWLLRANLMVASGARLVIHGSVIGGDVNELRLQSNNSTNTGNLVSITADWGIIDIKGTRITSWDAAVSGPDTELQSFGRAFIRARSRLASDGVTPQESRLDIVDSDIGYLGYDAAESHGLTWKVLGIHPDPSRSILEDVTIYGDIINSRIHDCFIGVHAVGAQLNVMGAEALLALPVTASDDNLSVHGNRTLNVEAPGILANDRDANGAGLKALLVRGPANGTLALNLDGSFSYSPALNFVGTDTFICKANNGAVDSNLETVTIAVLPVNQAPVAVDDDTFSVREDSAMNVSAPGVLGNDSDMEGESLSAVLVQGPANGTLLLNSDGSFNYTPALNFTGADSFTYRASDGGNDGNVAMVTITVLPANDAPVATDDTYSAREDTPLNVSAAGVLSNDSDVDGNPLRAILVSGPANGTLTLNSDGSFSYAPAQNFIGTDSFTYRVSDGAVDSNTATVTISVASSATFRWSDTSNRIYVEGGGTVSLTDIQAALPDVPLDLVDPTNRIWLLRANLVIAEGSLLRLHGAAIGGDVNEFRLQSNNSTNDGGFVIVMADWGSIDIRSTRITSWDAAVAGPDTEFKTHGRASVRVRSRLAPDGLTPLESRMDIVDSEISYLGHDAAESYGLTWKVLGAHPDPTKSIFDFVNVYGDVINSRLHHNLFGIYTYGAHGCQWLNNEVDHNDGYGIDPHDDSDYLLIQGNNVHHNGIGGLTNKLTGGHRGLHGIIASRRCDHVVIRENISWANVGNGIMLHRHCDDGLIENNQTFLNGDSGVALFDSDRSAVRNNLIVSNFNAGIRLSVGATENLIENNTIGFSGQYGIYYFPGTDPAEPDDVDPTVTNRGRRNQILNNQIHDCVAEGVKLTEGDESVLIGNNFARNGPLLRLASCAGTRFISNTIPSDVTVLLTTLTNLLPSVAMFKDQPLLNLRLNAYSSATFENDSGAVFDTGRNTYTLCSGSGAAARSSMVCLAADLGTNGTVVTRNLYVAPESGEVYVTPTRWDVTGALRKEWQAKATVSSATIDFLVGDLAPGERYSVFKNGKRVRNSHSSHTTFPADADGYIRFAIVPGTTKLVTYSVRQ